MAIKTIKVGALARSANRDGYWGVKVDGEDTWLNFKKQPEFQRGAEIKVDAGKDRVVSKFKVVKEAPKATGKPGFSRGFGGGKGKDAGPEIQWQHSQEMAIRAAEVLLANEAYKLGAKTKPMERHKQVMDLIDTLTVKFFVDVEEKGPLKKAKEVEQEAQDEAEDFDEDTADSLFDEDEDGAGEADFDEDVEWD